MYTSKTLTDIQCFVHVYTAQIIYLRFMLDALLGPQA